MEKCSHTCIVLLMAIFLHLHLFGQDNEPDIINTLKGDGYREKQYPGLGRAASEIFYSDKRINVSGYAEISHIESGNRTRDKSSGDLELYFDQLIRVTPFIGVRFTDRLFLTTEFGTEYLRTQDEDQLNFFPEAYLDYIFKPWLSFRLGLQPLNIGYINNNEEPVLFYSVNRPESERIILPTEWIEAGISLYGELRSNLNYALSITDGVYSRYNTSATWIRDGVQAHDIAFTHPAISGQLNYLPIERITLSISAYFNKSGKDEKTLIDGKEVTIQAPLYLLSSYARYDKSGFGLILFGTYGELKETYELYQLTKDNIGTGQVLGESVYAFYIEPSYDVLRLFGKDKKTAEEKAKHFWQKGALQLPVFLRYERINAHYSIDQRLGIYNFNQNNLTVLTMGFNIKPNEYLAFKFDVRMRENKSALPGFPSEEVLYEFGLGLEF